RGHLQSPRCELWRVHSYCARTAAIFRQCAAVTRAVDSPSRGTPTVRARFAGVNTSKTKVSDSAARDLRAAFVLWMSRARNVGGGWYDRAMACYDLATGEPCKGLDRFPTSPARDKVDLAAVLVGAVAGVRAGGLEFPDRSSEAWQELEKRLELLTNAAATLGSRIPRIRDLELAVPIARGLDTLLCNIAVGYNVLELAIGDGLAALETG